MIDARWLENVTVDVTELKIEYRTADCVERDDFTVQLIYNNDISNSTVTNTSDYVANTTKHFIFSSIQPGATISYTLQVIDANSNTVGQASTGSFVAPLAPSLLLPSSRSPSPPTFLSSKKYILLYCVDYILIAPSPSPSSPTFSSSKKYI